MYHMSANLAFGRREKNIWGYKNLQGGKKPIRKTEKKVAPNGNVTPLGHMFNIFKQCLKMWWSENVDFSKFRRLN